MALKAINLQNQRVFAGPAALVGPAAVVLRLLTAAVILPSASPVWAAQTNEPNITAADLPRVPAVEPQDAIRTFRLKHGFHIELVACEPNIASPVALSFDERGRLFVVEMIDYSERRDQVPHLGRIRMLEDTNGDGVYDRSTVYADNLAWPTAVFCYGGGIFVGATPDILYLKDTKGDGKADQRDVIFTGFAAGVEHINVQELLNSFIWGLDNRLHGATSGEGGMIHSLRHPEAKPIDLHGRDFAIDPRTLTMTSEAGGGQHGLSFDDYGRRFTCNNSDHLRLFMYDERYAARNPFYAMPPSLTSIATDGPAAEVYRISTEEPWRVIRTRWRIAGVMTGPVEGGGRSSGYFTGATGSTIYRGDAFPEEFRGDYFVAEVAFNLVHHKKLLPDGPALKGVRPADEQNVEFLASKDNWFRPVQLGNAPDGTLYVIDMYREIVEHPWSLPESIKKFLDLNSGSERGRIYRIVPDGFKSRPAPRLDRASTKELVALLEHPNSWHRDTASRLLYERQDPTAVPLLRTLFDTSKSPLGRLHALYALDGLNALRDAHVLRALNDPDPHLREHGIKLCEKFLKHGEPSPALWTRLRALTGDSNIDVRYQLAFTLGELTHPDRLQCLEEIVRRDVDSPWVQAAVLSSLAEGVGAVFAHLSGDGQFRQAPAGQEFLRQLVLLAGARNRPQDLDPVLAFLGHEQDSLVALSFLRALGDGLQRGGSSFSALGTQASIVYWFTRALEIASDRQASESLRSEAIRLLASSKDPQARSTLLGLLAPTESQTVQLAALTALGRMGEGQIASELLQHWPGFNPRVRAAALSVLLARPERTRALLKAIQSGGVQAAGLTTSQVKFLRNNSNSQIRELALEVLGADTAGKRQDVVNSYLPALQLTGDAQRGKAIYLERCVSCHRLGGNGFALGPDLVTVKNTGKEKMLGNILDPNREVAPQYIAFEIETKDGESAIGLIANETTTSLTVRQAYGKEQMILRPDIKAMRSLGQSLMPEGLEQGLSAQDMANLLEYIVTADVNK